MPTNLEKYLAGEPLTDELAALKRGDFEQVDFLGLRSKLFPAETRVPLADPERPLRAEERAALREIRTGPGWPVLQRLMERATGNQTNAAILLSQDDPAGKRDEIAQAWMAVKVWKHMVACLNRDVEQELREQEETGDGGDEDESTEQRP